MKCFLALLLLVCSPAWAASPWVYEGVGASQFSLSFPPNLDLARTVYILQGTADPSSSATSAPKGSLYLRTGASGGTLYVKQDSGSSTNWSSAGGGTLGPTSGGTGQSTYTTGDTLYASAANTLSKLAGNTTATKKYLSQTGTGSASQAPAWAQVAFSDLSGSNTCAQLPALTGGVTTSAGNCATTVITNANLTGPITSSGNATAIGSQTGTGSTFVMSAGPSVTGTLAGATSTWSGTVTSTGNLTVTSGTAFFGAGGGTTGIEIESGGFVEPYTSNSNDNVVVRGKGTGLVVFGYGQGSSGLRMYDGGTSNINFTVAGSGALFSANLAGTGSRAVLADATGNLSAPVSDVRLKKNIIPLTSQLNPVEALKKLSGVFFHWDTSKERVRHHGEQQEIGMIAQDVEKIVPQAVMEDRDGWKSLDYAHLVPLLIEAAKAQELRIQTLEKQVKQLQK